MTLLKTRLWLGHAKFRDDRAFHFVLDFTQIPLVYICIQGILDLLYTLYFTSQIIYTIKTGDREMEIDYRRQGIPVVFIHWGAKPPKRASEHTYLPPGLCMEKYNTCCPGRVSHRFHLYWIYYMQGCTGYGFAGYPASRISCSQFCRIPDIRFGRIPDIRPDIWPDTGYLAGIDP